MQYFNTLAIVSLLALTSGCKNNKTDTEEFLIRVDSIVHPDTVAAGKSFDLAFNGVIGPNGCYRFLRFEKERKVGLLKIWTVGERKTGQNLMCPEYLPMLEGTKLNIVAPDSGVLNIEVINPGLGNLLKSSVIVRQ